MFTLYWIAAICVFCVCVLCFVFVLEIIFTTFACCLNNGEDNSNCCKCRWFSYKHKSNLTWIDVYTLINCNKYTHINSFRIEKCAPTNLLHRRMDKMAESETVTATALAQLNFYPSIDLKVHWSIAALLPMNYFIY